MHDCCGARAVSNNLGKWGRVVELYQAVIRLDPFLTPSSFGANLSPSLYMMNRYSEAAEAARYCVQRAPTSTLCRSALIQALGQLGALDAARAEVEALLKISLGYTISERTRQAYIVYRDPAWVDRFADGLRKAGLPE